MLKRILFNKKYIAKITTTIVGGMYGFLGWISTFAPLDSILPESISLAKRIGISIIVVIIIWIIGFLAIGVILILNKRFEVFTANNGHKVFLQYGDLFSKGEVLSQETRRNIIIPVNRCFDVIVDNEVISEQTVHGMAIKKLYDNKLYDEKSLNDFIQSHLLSENAEMLSDKQKPRGNKKRFPEGTVVDIPVDETTHYLFWALSSFDEKLKAHTTMDEYVVAVQRMILACNLYSEGFPMVLPVVGAGLSRIKKNQNAIVSYLVNAFKLNEAEINSDIHIVVNSKVKDDVSIMNVK